MSASLDDSATALASWWTAAAKLLGIRLETFVRLPLGPGCEVSAPVLVKEFGAKNGIVVLADDLLTREEKEAIAQAGYGFSVMDPPAATEPVVLGDIVNILRDWGWAGPMADKPSWLMTGPSGRGTGMS